MRRLLPATLVTTLGWTLGLGGCSSQEPAHRFAAPGPGASAPLSVAPAPVRSGAARAAEVTVCRLVGPQATLDVHVLAGTESLVVSLDGARVVVMLPPDGSASSVTVQQVSAPKIHDNLEITTSGHHPA